MRIPYPRGTSIPFFSNLRFLPSAEATAATTWRAGGRRVRARLSNLHSGLGIGGGDGAGNGEGDNEAANDGLHDKAPFTP
jgi:hypothetical protein